MTSARSLGRHVPAGLEFLASEGIISSDSSHESVKWQTYLDTTNQDAVEEELVTTEHCVVWSRGGIIQRVFRLDLEEDPIVQSLLTWFDTAKDNSTSSKSSSHFTRSRALVVILKHLAHIYFLHGQSHVVNLPVEIERAFAAPCGIVLQRKIAVPTNAPSSPLSLRAPPNSLQASRNHIGSSPVSSAPQAPFSAQLFSPTSTSPLNLNKFALPQPSPAVDSTPSLLTLTDPLIDVGLVVESFHPVGMSPTFVPISHKEELLHIEACQQRFHSISNAHRSVTYVLTVNREESRYSVWRASYVQPTSLSQWNQGSNRTEQQLSPDLRRSFGQHSLTGGNTPGARSKSNKRDSFARDLNTATSFNASQSIPPRKSGSFMNDKAARKEEKLPVDPDFNSPKKNSAANRRASSMVARAELSTRESNQYKDWGRQSTGPSASQRPKSSRYRSSGFGKDRHSFEVALMPSLEVEDDSFATAADDTLDLMQVDSIRASKLRDRPIPVPRQDPFDPMKAELAMEKIVSIPYKPRDTQGQYLDYGNTLPEPSYPLEVFLVESTCGQAINIFIHNQSLHILSEISTQLAEPEEQHSANLFSITFAVNNTSNVIGASKLIDRETVAVAVALNDAQSYNEILLFSSNFSDFSDSPLSPTTSLLTKRSNAIPIKLSKPVEKMFSNQLQNYTTNPPYDSTAWFGKPLNALQNPGCLGEFDVVNDMYHFERYQLKLQPRHTYVNKVLEVCASLQPAGNMHDSIFHRWLEISHTFDLGTSDDGWKTLVVTIFSLLPTLNSTSDTYDQHSATDSDAFEIANDPSWQWIAQQGQDSTGPPSNTFLVACLKLARQFQQQNSRPSGGISPEAVILALHLLREEEKLNIISPEATPSSGYSLAPVLAQLGQWCGWPSWSGKPGSFYVMEEKIMENYVFDHSYFAPAPSNPPWEQPPSILLWIARSMTSHDQQDFSSRTDDILPYLPSGRSKHEFRMKMTELTPRTAAVSHLISFFSRDAPSNLTLDASLQEYFDFKALESFPEGIVIALRCFMSRSRSTPPTGSVSSDFKDIGRKDKQMVNRAGQGENGDVDHFNHPNSLFHASGLDIRSICEATSKAPERVDPYGSNDILKILFPDDTRALEPARLLNPQLVPIAIIHPAPGSTESQFLEAQQNHAKLVYIRTMSVVTGQALLEYHCHRPLPTQKLEIRLFNTSCKIQPSGITVNADRSNFVEEKVSWAFFHAGVQAGLRITKDAQNLDTSWLYLNKPNDLSNRHAGLLLGLGLNGHLKSMAKWLAFKYLTPKHDMTSIGLLLGLSASYLGTLDSLITRVLSIHLVSLLPPGSAELNLSPLVQTAGTMGIGLVYYNSQHRRMSEKMLTELEHVELEEQTLSMGYFSRDEGYRLAAGFALGLINLGKGKELSSLRGLQVEERLIQLATGPCDINLVHILDQATAGTTIAIALIFMKTELRGVAEKIDIPHTVKRFDTIRPDILLLRVLARNLIVWDEINSSQEWIWGRLPSDLRSQLTSNPAHLPPNIHLLDTVASGPLSSGHLSLYNILAGLCWSIGLKHAGTADTEARDCLLSYYDKVTDFLAVEPQSYDQRLTLDALMRFQHLCIISASIVMAGTGDLPVLTRTRVLHATVNASSTFGLHQAAHMAMGALFLGQGRLTFGTSDLAIASLIAAFYPLFPQEVLDNRAHLQAFRHLWVLATEPRCLFPRDIETRQIITTPIKIIKRDQTVKEITAPALLPDLSLISKVVTLSDEYWQVILDFEHNPHHLASFQKHQTIYLRRKSLIAQYDDPFSTALALHTDATLGTKNEIDAFKWIFNLPFFESLGIGRAEADSIFPRSPPGEGENKSGTLAKRKAISGARNRTPLLTLLDQRTTGIDDVLALREGVESENQTKLMNLLILFEWAEMERSQGRSPTWSEWIGEEAISGLRAAVVRRMMSTDDASQSEIASDDGMAVD